LSTQTLVKLEQRFKKLRSLHRSLATITEDQSRENEPHDDEDQYREGTAKIYPANEPARIAGTGV